MQHIKRGDFVRLNKGWTIMIVLDVNHCTGMVIAKYCSKYLPARNDWYYPETADGTQERHMSGFTLWNERRDGPIPKHMQGYNPMFNSTKYTTADGRVGIFVNHAGTNSVVLNMDIDNRGRDDMLEIHSRDSITECLPNTFQVKAVSSNYKCHYEAPHMKKPIKVGDLLLSDSGNMYTVLKINTQYRHPKKVFEGRRVKLTDI